VDAGATSDREEEEGAGEDSRGRLRLRIVRVGWVCGRTFVG
jgi:hypothetical protein